MPPKKLKEKIKKKVGRPTNRSRSGRPPKMSEATVKKLEDAFSMGCSDLEACLYADISKQTLYNYQDKNPDFVDRKQKLKERPVLKARTVVIQNLDDPKYATWYLERKRRDEFTTKTENELSIDSLSGVQSIKIEVVEKP